jgi:glyoxylase-like metal-dependent hydrolase (beta-lactamase superfamily II)
MIFEILPVGPLGANCFILGCEESREGVVVDPGGDSERIISAIERLGLRIIYIVNTHGHFDHVGGNTGLLEHTGARLLVHEKDVRLLSMAETVAARYGVAGENSPEPHSFLEDDMLITFGNHRIRVLHTPGHTSGGCCLYLAEEGMLISGDTLFADGVGRTDFPGGSHEQLIDSIRTKLLTLPEKTKVYPGHGPSTTIGREKRFNPYI